MLSSLFSLPLLLLLLVVSLFFSPSTPLTVHIVPHTHDDVGWLKTVDQYYTGLHNEIQHAMVQFILDSVILELSKDPQRKFVYVEQAFFQRWWRQQSEATRNLTRGLVSGGQLEFANGGWCMHDEATTYYVDMIDQTTLGHRFIQQEFGDAAIPTIGWQLDPFGHSATQASLLSAQLGFDALFFGRIDHVDHDLRMQNRTMEFVWAASPSLGQAGSVFTGAFQSGNYGAPPGMCWDWTCGDDPIQDDPRLNDYNVEYFVQLFNASGWEYASHTAGDFASMNVMWNMGSDFQHEASLEWMRNIDKLILHVNNRSADTGITAQYSTPSQYVRAKNAEKVTWTVKRDDFFPYSDDYNAYWTGYFTSRPALKRYIRLSGAFLQVVRHFEVFSGEDGTVTEPLWEAQSVAQHHDAVSGTAKQAVTFDYAQRIAKGSATADAFLQKTLGSLVTMSGDAPAFQSCPLANVSVCPVSVGSNNLVVLLYNPTGHNRTEQVSIVVADSNLGVANAAQQFIASQLVPVMPNAASTPDSGPYRLVFSASIPPLSWVTYFITEQATPSHRHHKPHSTAHSAPHLRAEMTQVTAPYASTYIESDLLRVDFNDSTGLITSITDKASGVASPFTHDFAWYNSYQNESLPGQLDGAYVFRPLNESAFSLATNVTLRVAKGGLVQEVWQTFTPWLSQIVRVRQGSRVVELEWTVGPIPLSDHEGKNIVSRYNSTLASNATWYTDSNGREMQKRVRDYRPTWAWTRDQNVSSNYYPVNAATWLTDGKQALVINNDRSQAGGSIVDGHLELLVHRRLISDDAKGVSEALNEPGLDGKGLIVTGLTTVALLPVTDAPMVARTQQNRMYSYLHQSIAPLTQSVSDYLDTHHATRSYANAGVLPAEVEMTTLQVAPVSVNGSQVLIRFSHSYGVDEVGGKVPVTFDVAKLLVQPIKGMVELGLAGVAVKRPNSGYVWNTTTAVSEEEEQGEEEVVQQSATTVTLNPMEVKTFGLIL